jgi:cytochrome c peroxidase
MISNARAMVGWAKVYCRNVLCQLHPKLGFTPTIMTLSLLRIPVRRAFTSAAAPRSAFRSSYRRFTNGAPPPPPPPPKSSGTGLYVGVGVVALAAGAYYFYATSPSGADAATAIKSAAHSAKVAIHHVPTKVDYQKVQLNVSSIPS